MLTTLKTLFLGATAQAEDHLRDTCAIALIDQHIREAEDGLRAAKSALASLIQSTRTETLQTEALEQRIRDLTGRAQAALSAGNMALARQATEAIAQMENELSRRRDTLDRLAQKTTRLRASVEAGHRRLVDLKQGAVQARAIRREQAVQSRLRHSDSTPFDQAEALIARVTHAPDPVERAEILQGINRDLTHDGLTDRMAAAGFGPATRVTAADVLARLTPAN